MNGFCASAGRRVAPIAFVALAFVCAIDDAASQVAPPPPPPVVRPGARGRGAGFTSGGGGDAIGFGVGAGAAAVGLGLGLLGSSGSPRFSGENSRQIVTPVETNSQEAPPRPPRHHLKTPGTPNSSVTKFRVPGAPRVAAAASSTSEPHYVPNEVLLVVRDGTTARELGRFESSAGLTPVASSRIELLHVVVRRYSLKPGRSVPAAIAKLRTNPVVVSVQANHLFNLQEGSPPAPSSPPTQYVLKVLHLPEAHRLAQGRNVRVAVIDSGVDETNADLEGAVVERFDAVGGTFKPHSHGTAIGGAIVAHHNLVGIAPQAQLIAIRAFSGFGGSASGASFDILRGLDFAAAHGARVVNMSFAGPDDRLLDDALAAARGKGTVIVAAAGNGGPLAKPLYPGAAPGIIAVTATDAEGKPFASANRGAYIAVAAPGVNVIAPGLGKTVQITSGTSIATAEVSGVVALILERNPHATPDEVRAILRRTARPLAVDPPAAGAGVIDAERAVSAAR